MAGYSITLTEFERVVLRFEPKIRAAYVKALRTAALRLEGMVVEEIQQTTPYAAVDTGELMRSVDTTFVDDGAIVTVAAPHAGVMEWGARPFKPPIAPLVEWVKRKGLVSTRGPRPLTKRQTEMRSRLRDRAAALRSQGLSAKAARSVAVDQEAERIAFLIARSMSLKGIAPRGYFAKAFARLPPILRHEVYKELAKLPGAP